MQKWAKQGHVQIQDSYVPKIVFFGFATCTKDCQRHRRFPGTCSLKKSKADISQSDELPNQTVQKLKASKQDLGKPSAQLQGGLGTAWLITDIKLTRNYHESTSAHLTSCWPHLGSSSHQPQGALRLFLLCGAPCLHLSRSSRKGKESIRTGEGRKS